VQDLSVIEVEVFGISDQIIDIVREQIYVDTVSTENRGQKQVLLVQSPQGADIVSKLLAVLQDVQVGRVSIREPTLEDAYVRLVGKD
jgi:ABC-2 type transport system ATP-binding protein